MTLRDDIQRSAAAIRTHAPQRTPRVGMVLGSGWQGVVDHVDEATAIAYTDLPAFPLVRKGRPVFGRAVARVEADHARQSLLRRFCILGSAIGARRLVMRRIELAGALEFVQREPVRGLEVV